MTGSADNAKETWCCKDCTPSSFTWLPWVSRKNATQSAMTSATAFGGWFGVVSEQNQSQHTYTQAYKTFYHSQLLGAKWPSSFEDTLLSSATITAVVPFRIKSLDIYCSLSVFSSKHKAPKLWVFLSLIYLEQNLLNSRATVDEKDCIFAKLNQATD